MAALTFVIRRLLQALLVMTAIATVGFAVQQSIGDPARELIGEGASLAERAALRQRLGLDDPWPEQLLRFLGRAAAGDLGASYTFRQPALGVILSKFSATFELVLAASLIVIAVSIPGGIYCALRPGGWQARTIMVASVAGLSVPVFLTGILAIALFSVQLGWLPSYGRGDTVALGAWTTGLLTSDGLLHLLLPSFTLASIMVPLFLRLVRSQMLEALSQDYVRTARAKGLPPMRVWLSHALRNAAIPLVTLGGLQVGTLLAYTILTETVFQWPGMGFLFLDAVARSDTPLIIAYMVFVGALFVLINTLVDLAYLLIDPRVTLAGPVR
ncbi:MAG: ABC transporter permease [Pseudomonadota bacterium]|nr:ABC transporter permease [Pseudomonadota bacterium]